jgi:hypothetical protein
MIKPLILGSLLVAASCVPAYAASQAACGIWLCLPMGFPAGCGAEKAAFLHRMEHFKSPLPSFSSCSVSVPTLSGVPNDMFTANAPCVETHRHGFHRECVRWRVQLFQNGTAYGKPYYFSS